MSDDLPTGFVEALVFVVNAGQYQKEWFVNPTNVLRLDLITTLDSGEPGVQIIHKFEDFRNGERVHFSYNGMIYEKKIIAIDVGQRALYIEHNFEETQQEVCTIPANIDFSTDYGFVTHVIVPLALLWGLAVAVQHVV
ncbi:MAG: hypothetical protein ACMG6E_06950 [Candidatus Roizmanbacteria bacterium]